MSKIPFDIKFRPQIESGEYKVVTGDDRPVRIISWDKKVFGGRYEIVALVPTSQGDTEAVQLYCPDGTLISSNWNEKFKLFIVTPEPELTEFEQEVSDIVEYCKEHGENVASYYAKRHAKGLLSIARKQLQPEIDAEIEKAYKTAYDVQYRKGREEALKDLPRWKPSNCPRSNLPSLYLTGDGTALYKDGYEISISGLEKLPKEETNL